MRIDFTGKRALVTGGGRGIGKEIATQLAASGAEVVVFDIVPEDLEVLRKTINCETVQVDLSDVEATKRAARQALPIDLLVNSAGVVNLEPFLHTSVENFHSTLNINVLAMMVVSQVVAQNMVDRKCGGSIVNISSAADLVAFPDHTTYCISKAGVDGLTRCMASELGPYKIRTNAVAPITTMTPMGKKAWSEPSKSEKMLEKIPMGRFNDPIDVANAVLLLLSEQAAMVNGAILAVDGGFQAKG